MKTGSLAKGESVKIEVIPALFEKNVTKIHFRENVGDPLVQKVTVSMLRADYAPIAVISARHDLTKRQFCGVQLYVHHDELPDLIEALQEALHELNTRTDGHDNPY